jgi:hypothetical protein
MSTKTTVHISVSIPWWVIPYVKMRVLLYQLRLLPANVDSLREYVKKSVSIKQVRK